MNRNIKALRTLWIVPVVLLISSCSGDWLDINNDPNNPVDPDIELLVPSMQTGMINVLVDRFDVLAAVGQNIESTDTQYDLGSDGGIPLGYEELYVDALINAQRIINDAPLVDPPLTTHSGMAKVLKAYIFTVLVDLWGDAPFDEALLGAEGPDAPKWESGDVLYPKILSLLNEGIQELQAGGLPPLNDIIYNGSTDNWVKFANTIKLKMALNISDAGLASQAINDGVIDSNDDDADFIFGSGLAPENRHRMYQLHYQSNKAFYMSNYLMYTMYKSYGNPEEADLVDPRMRYYFYRQITSFEDAVSTGKVVPDDFPCFGYGSRYNDPSTWLVTCAYGYVGDGYIGRDHGDGQGIPNDGGSRTTYGAYPIGGMFDDGSGKTVGQSDGTGAGIYPIMTNAMANFMKAEAVLRLGVAGDARTFIEAGLRASIEDVMAYGSTANNFNAALAPTANDVEAYVSAVMARYDASPDSGTGDNAGTKLDVVMEQWHIANYGNTIESFINLRRTKLPFVRSANNLTARMSIQPVNTYPRRIPFPQSELATNPNAPDPDQVVWFQTPIFWDDNNYPDRF